jgi:hypothetical protein
LSSGRLGALKLALGSGIRSVMGSTCSTYMMWGSRGKQG